MKKKMKKMFRLALCAVLALTMVAGALPAMAAKLEKQPSVMLYLDGAAKPEATAKLIENGYITVGTDIEAGTVSASLSVTAEDASEEISCDIYIASYKESMLSTVKKTNRVIPSSTVAGIKPGERTASISGITVEEGEPLKLFTWRNENMAPDGEGAGFVRRGTYIPANVKVGTYVTVVDVVTKSILVKATAEEIAAATVTFEAPMGASCAVVEGNAALAVIPDDGSATVNWQIKAVADEDVTYFDFKYEKERTLPTAGGAGYWFNGSGSPDATGTVAVEYAKDPLDETNMVIKVSDNHANSTAVARYNISMDAPYVISYKIMGSVPNDTDDLGYSGLYLYGNDYKEIVRGGFTKKGSNYYYAATQEDGTNALHSSCSSFELDTWHEVSIVVNSNDDIKYYYDGKLYYEGAKHSNSNGILNSIRFTTHKTRTGTFYLDDIMIRSGSIQ